MPRTTRSTDRQTPALRVKGGSQLTAMPIALNLTQAAESVGLDYDTALKHRLFEIWQEAGLIWTVPGTQIRRVLLDALRQWVYKNQEETRPGTLAALFKDHEPFEKHSRRAM
jgi:hypothetical protein